jgi:ketosteroid isomerase-like protein
MSSPPSTPPDESLPASSRREALLLCALAGVGVAGTSHADAGSSKADFAGIDARYDIKRRAYQTGQIELLRDIYTRDVLIVGEKLEPLLGLEKVLELYSKVLPAQRGVELQTVRRTSSPAGDMVYDFTHFRPLPRDPAKESHVSTVLFIWMKAGGEWRCTCEVILHDALAL